MNLFSLESSFNCSISPLVRSEFYSLHESLCGISSKLDLLSLPSSQAAPDLPNADLQSPQSLVASNFFARTVRPDNLFATALPSNPLKSPSPSLIPKQQPASSPTSSSSLPAFNPISPSTSPSSLIISKWPASSPSSPSSLSPSSDYLSSSPSLSPSLSSLSSSSSTVLSLPSPTTSPSSFQPIHSTGPPHPPPQQQKVYTLSLSQSSLSILYFNVRSMLSNLSSFTSSVLLSNPDIVCVTDTWLSPDILSSEVGIPGFTLFCADRSRHGGGVAIFPNPLCPLFFFLSSQMALNS